MSNAAMKNLVLGCLLLPLLLTGCNTYVGQAPATLSNQGKKTNVPISCQALKRQQVYNQTNMNTETNNTTDAQRQALDQMIAANCQ